MRKFWPQGRCDVAELHGEKRAFLEEWFAELLGSGCDIVPFDREAALACAALEAEARPERRTVEGHFRGFGVPIYDPFKDVHLM